jgi:hypothetical protein
MSGNNESSRFNISGGSVYNSFVGSQIAGNVTGSNNYIVDISDQRKTLAEAAIEIQQLLKQLELTNPSASEVEKIAYVNDETTPSFKRRVVSSLQAGGEVAIDEFTLNNKYFKVAKATIEGWLKPDS